MTCNIQYEEMMSLKLDGLLDAHEEHRLDTHLVQCDACAPVWAALQEADAILCASTATMLPIPADFHARVMSQVAAAPVRLPHWATDRALTTPLPPLPTTRSIYGDAWQHGQTEVLRRVASYARGIVGVGLSLAGVTGLLLLLLLSGTIKLSEPFAPTVEILRTFFNTAAMWVRSLAVGVGTDVLGVGALVLSLLVFVGWQVVTSYQRNALELPNHTAYLEAA